MRIEILDEAEADLAEGIRFYEEQEAGAGGYFFESIFDDIAALRNHAGVHRKVYGWHRCVASKFPHAIFYRVEADVIKIRAIIDSRRDPARIRRRLRRRD